MSETPATVEEILFSCEERMEKSADFLLHEFQRIRTGKASPALVEGIMVNYHGTPTRLRDLSGISTPEPRMIVIQPWDPSAIAEIVKAIQASNLGISPASDGRVIRLVLPELSEERRKELDRMVKKMAEDAKIAIRNIRREANDHAKALQKQGDISEDEMKQTLSEIQTLTDKSIELVDTHLKHKEEEIMTI
jgi:ribosome recycling factor